MDKLKGLAGKVGGNKEQNPSAAGGSGGQKDYVDKGLEAGEKKFGVNVGSGTNEAVTDKGREMFEKGTG
ncbi:MAG: hypothetical protein Q9182_003380 [Xanthomendoza sp. 2 TL-2023]